MPSGPDALPGLSVSIISRTSVGENTISESVFPVHSAWGGKIALMSSSWVCSLKKLLNCSAFSWASLTRCPLMFSGGIDESDAGLVNCFIMFHQSLLEMLSDWRRSAIFW